MEMLGIVDAVWSGDSDSVMFGSRTVICSPTSHPSFPRPRPPIRLKSGVGHTSMAVRVFRLERITSELGWTREGILLFALLKGCDYILPPVPAFPEALASRLAKDFPQLRKDLLSVTRDTVGIWRASLVDAMATAAAVHAIATRRKISPRPLPADFPDWIGLSRCRWPIVTDKDELQAATKAMDTRHPTFRGGTLWTAYYYLTTVSQGPAPHPWWPIRVLLPIEINAYLKERIDKGEANASDDFGIRIKHKSRSRPGETSVVVKPADVFQDLDLVFKANSRRCDVDLNKEMTFRLLDGVVFSGLLALNVAAAAADGNNEDEADTSDTEAFILQELANPELGGSSLGKRKLTDKDLTPRSASRRRKRRGRGGRRSSANRYSPSPSPSPPGTGPTDMAEAETADIRWAGPWRRQIRRALGIAKSYDGFKKALETLERNHSWSGRAPDQSHQSLTVIAGGYASTPPSGPGHDIGVRPSPPPEIDPAGGQMARAQLDSPARAVSEGGASSAFTNADTVRRDPGDAQTASVGNYDADDGERDLGNTTPVNAEDLGENGGLTGENSDDDSQDSGDDGQDSGNDGQDSDDDSNDDSDGFDWRPMPAFIDLA